MARRFAMSLLAALCLSACADPGATTTEPTAQAPAIAATMGDAAQAPAPGPAWIAGAILAGNRQSPALRACAHPLAGGAATCVAVAAGAGAYRIEVTPGRYHVLGWIEGAGPRLFAHASQVRCIRAPCPPDALIEVEVAAGVARTGIDLKGAYTVIPEGWPSAPG